MSCVRFAIVALAGLLTTSIFGGTYTWRGGDGHVSVGSNYEGGTAPNGDPGSTDVIKFRSADAVTETSRVLFPMSYYLNALNFDDATDPSSRDLAAVTLEGPSGGGTLHLANNAQLDVSTGRELTIRDLSIVRDNPTGGAATVATLRDKAKLTFGPGSHLETTEKAEYFYVLPGSLLTIDGGCLSLAGIDFRSGAALEMRSGKLQVPSLPNNPGICFKGGEIVHAGSVGSYHFLPQGSDATLTIQNAGITALDFRDVVPDGTRIPWRGTVDMTNGVDSTFIADFSGTIYGGGKLRTGSVYLFTKPVTQDIWLAEISLAKSIHLLAAAAGSDFRFHGDTTFSHYNGTFTWDHEAERRYDFFGKVTFSTYDAYAKTVRNMSMHSFAPAYRSSIAVNGGGKLTVYYFNAGDGKSTMSARHRAFELSDGSTYDIGGESNSDRDRVRVQDLKMDANSTYSVDSAYLHGDMVPEVIGSVVADATAKVHMRNIENSTTKPASLFVSLDDEATLPQYETTSGIPVGYSVKRIGGCLFLDPDGGVTVPTAAGQWSGNGTTGNWSDGDNWFGTRVGWYNHVFLNGSRHLYSTNDITEEASRGYASLNLNASAGPFHLSGVAIPLSLPYSAANHEGAINNKSDFPAFFELQLSSSGNSFGAVSQSGKAIIVFRDKVSVPNGSFVPDGSIVVEGAKGEVTAKEIHLVSGSYRPTILTVQKGGTVTASLQETVNDAVASLWIAKNGTVDVTGDWKWNVNSNEHQIDGALNVSGNLGGDAAQSYFGEGVVKIGGTSDETTAVRIGEGVTLAPAGWGQMKLDVVSSAKVGAQADWTYAAASLDVTGLDAEVTFIGDQTITVDAPFVGHDFKVAKEGAGTLVLASGVGTSLASRAVSVEAGMFAWTDDMAVGELKVESGTTLAFGKKANGEPAALSLGASVDLDGVTVKPFDADGWTAIDAGAKTILTVPFGCSITGTPTVPEKIRLRTVVNTDGSMSLKAKTLKGMAIILR